MHPMIGPHDVGGMHLGSVPIRANEPLFHANWERGIFGAVICAIIKGAYNVDQFRSGIEQMAAAPYLKASYYEKWLFTLEYNLKRAGVLSDDAIQAQVERLRRNPNLAMPERKDEALLTTLNWLIPAGHSSRTQVSQPPGFTLGAVVRGKFVKPEPHTRIPGYCQGKVGRVRLVHDAYPLVDEVVRHGPESPQYIYSVGFPARDLWPDAEPGTEVCVDLWESYLEPVT